MYFFFKRSSFSGSSPCTSPKHAAPYVRHGLAIQFLHDSIHVRIPILPYHLSGSSPCTSPNLPVSNIDWQFISYMIAYMFQCHSPKSSHPLPEVALPQSPKDCSIHLCLFCCLAYRVIVTIFLNSIYMH